ncbi:hypothetical protein OCU04_005902 [Sclerotinia nivalis]|uniref:Uncharacterized protein n=1 Tax=Sclerotinia nivalis TaxID=352851 RepID=A0A9X0DKQ4_9HELO|nr:hypothetical protein OCU04_005902 [Sclerotinia nivalis]
MQNSTSRRAAESDTKNSRSRQPAKRARAPSDSDSSEPNFDDSKLYNDRPLEAYFDAKRDYQATLARTPRGYGYDSDTDDMKEFKETAEIAKKMLKSPEKTHSSRKERAPAETPRATSSRTSTTNSRKERTPAESSRKERTPPDSSRSERTPARSNTNTDNVKAMSSLKLSNPPRDRSDTRKQAPPSSRSGPISSGSSSSTSKARETTTPSRPKTYETRSSPSQRTHKTGFKISPGRDYTLESYPKDHEDAERRGKTHYVCLVSRSCRELHITMLRDVEQHLRDFHWEALGGSSGYSNSEARGMERKEKKEGERPKVREVAGSGSGKGVGESSKSAGRR